MKYLTMNLINDEKIDNIDFKFYEGIDFKIALEHPKDGSKGFLVFFVNNWIKEVKLNKRNNIIDSIIDDVKYNRDIELIDINNNFISIYQTNGNTTELYNIVVNKLRKYETPNEIRGIFN